MKKDNKTGAKTACIATSILAVSLLAGSILIDDISITKENQLANTYTVVSDAIDIDLKDDGILPISYRTLNFANYNPYKQNKITQTIKELCTKEETLCTGEHLRNLLIEQGIDIIELGTETYSKNGVVTTIEYETTKKLGMKEEPATTEIITDKDGKEYTIYVAPEGAVLKGNKAVYYTTPTVTVDSQGNKTYSLPSGYQLITETEIKTYSVSKEFPSLEEFQTFLTSIDESLTIDDITIDVTQTKTYEELPSIIRTNDTKTLLLK